MGEQVSLSLNLSLCSGHTVPDRTTEALYDCIMQRQMQRDEARKVITSALWLAKERVVGELNAKEIDRERLADLSVRMGIGMESPPSAADLTEALGNPDDGEIRQAIRVWSQEDAPVTPQ